MTEVSAGVGLLVLAASLFILTLAHQLSRVKACKSCCASITMSTPRNDQQQRDNVAAVVLDAVERRLSRELPSTSNSTNQQSDNIV